MTVPEGPPEKFTATSEMIRELASEHLGRALRFPVSFRDSQSPGDKLTRMKILILSAPVGEGHDAAARGIVEHVAIIDPSVDVSTESMHEVTGQFIESAIVNVYRFQLAHAPWSYKWLYDAIVRSRRFTAFLKMVSGRVAGARTQDLIEESGADVVISTYPVTSAILEWLKIRGRLKVPCANLLTDFAPHPMWTFVGIDVNYVVHEITLEAVKGMIGPAPMRVVSPPVAQRFWGPSVRAEGRRRLGLNDGDFVALIAGGGWGVGSLAEAAEVAASVEGIVPIVLCGRNEALRQQLSRKPPGRSMILGFVDYLPELLDAADVLVHNAGGLTSLEAFVRGCPVVISNPIAGHGVANAKLMSRSGVAKWARTEKELAEILKMAVEDPEFAADARRLAQTYHALPSVAESLLDLAVNSG